MGTGPTFFGRGEDLDTLAHLAKSGERLITLTGPGGVGKTRLARKWSERDWDERGQFCDLAAARTLGEVCSTVARSLGIGGPQPKDTTQVDRIGRALAARGRTLIILDNCEQAVEPIARAVTAWHALARETVFVLTSREPLHVPAERVHPVPPLSLPEPGADPASADAVRMFFDRVARVRPGWELGPEDARIASEIVRRLDGLPLAIELAAARAAVLGVPAILERLARRLDLLSSGPRDLAERQRTMRNAIQWSWELLDPAEQAAIAQCSVFRGGFGIDAAEAVIELPAGAPHLDIVQGLVDKSMLRSYEAHGDVRLGMYDAIREFCAERLDEMGTEVEARERHAAYYVRASARWAAEIASRKGAERMHTLAIELENLLAAHEHALAGTNDGARDAAELMLAMIPPLTAQGSVDELLRLLDASIDRAAGVSVVPIASLLTARAEARAMAAQLDGARADLERALDAARKAGDRTTEGRALGVQGLVDWYAGNYAEAEKTFERAVDLSHAAGDSDHEAIALRRLANMALDRHRIEEARSWIEKARELVARTGNRREEGTVLGTLALIFHLGRRYEDAEAMGIRALRAFRELGEGHREAVALGNLGIVEQQLRKPEEARTFFEAALAGARWAGDRRLFGHATLWLARLDHEEGRLEPAWERYVEGLDLLAEVNGRRAPFLAARAALEADRGNVGGAAALLLEADKETPADDAHAKATVAVYRAYVTRSSAEEARALAEPFAEESEDVAFALRLLEPRTPAPRANTISPPSDALHIGPEGTWFRAPRGSTVDLSKRRSLRLVLLALARHREEAPGQPLTVEALVKLGWPGERMQSKSGAMRAYTSITRLRKLGLSEVLVSRGTGYMLDPRVPIASDDA
jgi:predicted ATPase